MLVKKNCTCTLLKMQLTLRGIKLFLKQAILWEQLQQLQQLLYLDFGGDPTVDAFELTHTADANIEVMKTVASAMANAHGGFVTIQDDLGTAFSSDGATLGVAMTDLRYPSIASTGTAVTVSAVALTGI